MSKPRRVARPKSELKAELVEQLQLLRQACQSFDSGFEPIGKHIALILRVLLHHKGQSRSLLDQLELRSGRFFDSAGALHAGNLLTECNLVAHRFTDTSGSYVPLILAGFPPVPMKPIVFVDWWNNPVLKDNCGRTFCRRELVAHVADTDGGAHVDPELDEAYMAISRSNSLNWEFVSGNSIDSLMKAKGVAFGGRPELACMRQIAHELLCTIHEFVPEFSTQAQPVIPPAP